ncbi:MAG TPA: phosphatase PAP2 family protein [Geobacteraceae bacterium]
MTTIATAVCIRSYDITIASYVRGLALNGSGLASEIPDTLLLMVCAITAVAGVCYITRKNKGVYDRNTMFFHLVMYAAPASFVVKSLLKYVFGRVTTREWLIKPHLYGFHWFHGGDVFGGFPSGHMVVFTAMAAALWRYYPRYRPACAGFLLVLALALIVTNYHFLSDVIAGAYLGVLSEFCTYKACRRCRPPA